VAAQPCDSSMSPPGGHCYLQCDKGWSEAGRKRPTRNTDGSAETGLCGVPDTELDLFAPRDLASQKSGTQFPWKPQGTRCGKWTTACGSPVKSAALTTSRSLAFRSAS
jgi:hypothetical protein